MTWRVARALDVLLDELNVQAPDRNRLSDGGIGDAAHATRDSDHNPWVKVNGVGVVRARDFTHDPPGGLDCQQLADRLADMIRARAHPALGYGAYIIWGARIFSAARVNEGWRDYYGSNPHERHLHLSVALDPIGFDSPQLWRIFTEEEDDMFTDADRRALRQLGSRLTKVEEQQDRILARVDRGGVIRTRLARLIQQGRATKRELEELNAHLDDDEPAERKRTR